MLCVIPHICKNSRDHLDQQYNKKHLREWSLEEMAVNKEILWTEYTDFDNKNGSFDGDEFIYKSKDIRYGNINSWYQKYSLPCTKVIGFVAWRVKLKVIDIGAAESSWSDVKTIKPGKISDISSDISEKHCTVYTSACIESARTEQYHSDKQLTNNCWSHTWNEDDDDFDQQLEKWGVEKVFSDQPEPVTIEIIAYIRYWGKFLVKKNDQRTCTRFLDKYWWLSIYDIDFEKINSIYDKAIHFLKGYVYDLVGNPNHPYVTSTDNEYFFINDDLFDRI